MITNTNVDDVKSAVKSKNVPNGSVPGFIRLFIIHRIIHQHCAKGTSTIEHDSLNSLPKAVKTLLTSLATHGIKNYMKNCYNEANDPKLVELIMDEIIFNCKQFTKEYQQIIHYQYNYNNNHQEAKSQTNTDGNMINYQELLFNTSDLMCKIFQHLEFSNLLQCDLVCTHWLYQTWNVNSIYFADILRLIDNTSASAVDGPKKLSSIPIPTSKRYSFTSSIWQRLIKVKSIELSSLMGDQDINNIVLNKVSLFANIEIVVAYIHDNYSAVLKRIVEQNRNKIKYLEIMIIPKRFSYRWYPENVLSAIKLTSVESITFGNMYFYPIWSNKCQSLVFRTRIKCSPTNKEFCNHVIQHCDCSGVKLMHLHNVLFESSVTPDLVKSFGEKFSNLKLLKINVSNYCDDKKLFSLLKGLKNIIKKNGTNIEIKLSHELSGVFYSLLNETIVNNELKITRFELDEYKDYVTQDEDIFSGIKKIIKNGQLEQLVINIWNQYEGRNSNDYKWQQNNDDNYRALKHLAKLENYRKGVKSFSLIVNFLSNDDMKETLFKSLNVIKIKIDYFYDPYSVINDINNLLKLILVLNKKDLFFDGVFNLDYEIEKTECNGDFIQLFKLFCQNIFDLMIKNHAPIDITLSLKDKILLNDGKSKLQANECNEIFSSYCDEAIKCYTQPQCNNNNDKYISLEKPKISYICIDKKKNTKCDYIFQICNVKVV